MHIDGVALYHSRIPMVSEVEVDTLAQMKTDLPAAVRLFPPAVSYDVIGYGCTSASVVLGTDKVREVIQGTIPDAAVTDPLSALIAAAKTLSLHRVGVVTPYLPEITARLREKLDESGVEVTHIASFEEKDDRVVARITEASIAAAAESVARQADCQAIIVSCTNLRCLDVIPELETALNLPVLTSNQALAWHMLRLSGITDVQPRFGKLFEAPLAKT
jgi:maleate isomerase